MHKYHYLLPVLVKNLWKSPNAPKLYLIYVMECYVAFIFRVVSDMVCGYNIILNLKGRIKCYNICYNFNFNKQSKKHREKLLEKKNHKKIHPCINRFPFCVSKFSYIIT